MVALRTGQIAGAGFDVVSTEPPPDDHPLVELLELPNFILTPMWPGRARRRSRAWPTS